MLYENGMKRFSIEPPAAVHLIGICGTGMGALAGLLVKRGFRVTGSDLHAYPPMSEELERVGIAVMEGFHASHLDHRPDLVVIGNVCRPDHVEAVAAAKRGLLCASMAHSLAELFLRGKKTLVITGTHGKTTTTALTAYLLFKGGLDPSFFLGGVAADFNNGYRLGKGDWFVVEGDEYDSAYFEKTPKFLSYAPQAAVMTSVEHDHVDIYPTFEEYKRAFSSFIDLIPHPGPLAVYVGDPVAVELSERARAEVVTYGVEGDNGSKNAAWRAKMEGESRFQLAINGRDCGVWNTPLKGRHNLRNALAALILCHKAAGVSLEQLKRTLPEFSGVKRRQEVIARPRGISLYDDFAHHPTAVKETLGALAAFHAPGRLLAVFEPRSATACRRLHQEEYAEAFNAAGEVIIAPLGRVLPVGERLDTSRLAQAIEQRGIPAFAAETLEEVFEHIVAWARPGDGIALLSNGDFGGLRTKLIERLK